MFAEWSAECAADDPVLVVPWRAAPGMGEFVDLRENPYDLDHIPEADRHAPMMHALRALNAARSPVFSAKCDAWELDQPEREALAFDLELTPLETPCGFGSYIDLVWRERAIFVSFQQQEQRLTRLSRLVEAMDHPYAALSCVLRPAFVDLERPQEGFAFSVYVKALGTDPPHAYERWSLALEAVVALLRGKDFSAG